MAVVNGLALENDRNYRIEFQAIPHNRGVRIAQTDFSADETKNAGNSLCIPEAFCEICRKRCKQDVRLLFVRCCLKAQQDAAERFIRADEQ